MIGSLAVVCALCVLVTRWMGKRGTADAGNMEVLASLAVDAQCGVYLVRAGERRLVMGIDAAGVKALVELPRSIVEPATENQTVPATVVHSSPSTTGPDRQLVAELLTRLRAAA